MSTRVDYNEYRWNVMNECEEMMSEKVGTKTNDNNNDIKTII